MEDRYYWFPFNASDWLSDPLLSMCQPATRGIWIDAIAAMLKQGRSGALVGTPCQLARVTRCTEAAFMDALNDLLTTGTADVTNRNGVVTLINRRMQREAKEREDNRLRQQKKRGSQECHAPVTPMSPSNCDYSSLFDLFWNEYPRKEAKQPALKAFRRLEPDKETVDAILSWLKLARESDQWQQADKIPHAATLLNQRRWESDPPPKSISCTKPKDTIGQSEPIKDVWDDVRRERFMKANPGIPLPEEARKKSV